MHILERKSFIPLSIAFQSLSSVYELDETPIWCFECTRYLFSAKDRHIPPQSETWKVLQEAHERQENDRNLLSPSSVKSNWTYVI